MMGLILLGLAALGLRLAFFGISTSNVPESSDESLSPLQAERILDEGRRPLLVMANPYQFPVESYLHVPFVNFLPRSALGARLIPFLLCLAATLAMAAALLKVLPLRTAWPGLALILFPSPYLMTIQSAYFIPQHSSFALLFALALLCAFNARAGRAPGIFAFLAGAAAGLAFSNHMLAFPLLVMLVAFFLLAPPGPGRAKMSAAFLSGAALGLLPYILARVMIPGAYESVTRLASLNDALHRVWNGAFTNALSGAMGIRPCLFPDGRRAIEAFPGAGGAFAAAWAAVMLACASLALIRFMKVLATARRPALEAEDVITGAAWIGFLMFAFGARSDSHTYRYLLPIVLVFPFMAAHLYARADRGLRTAIGACSILLAIFNFVMTLALMREWARPDFAAREANLHDLKPAIAYLDGRGIRHACASYWVSYRITYETGGRILCSQPVNERFPGWSVPYKDEVDSATNVAYIMAPGTKWKEKHFQKDLAWLKTSCRREELGSIAVYTDFQRDTLASCDPLPQKMLSVSAEDNADDAPIMTDGYPFTLWDPGPGRKEKSRIEIGLMRPETVCGVSIRGVWPPQFAGMISVETLAGGAWKPALPGELPMKYDRVAYRNNHPVYGLPVQTIYFDPVQTDRLKITVSDLSRECDWAIGEIEVFGRAP